MAKSLAAQAGVVPDLPALPDAFTQTDVVVAQRFNCPYLVFAQPKAEDQWREILAAFSDVEDGDPVIFFPSGKKVRAAPLRMSLMAAQQYYCERVGTQDGQGFLSNAPGRQERIHAALLVYLPDSAVPCTCTFRSTKCPAAATISAENQACQLVDWAKLSVAHEQAVAACRHPWMRVVGTIAFVRKTGKSSGMAYTATRASVAPSTTAEWQLFSRCSPTNFENTAIAYKDRLSQLALKP